MRGKLRGTADLYQGATRLGRVRYHVVTEERTQAAPVMGEPGARAPALGLVTGRIEPLEGLDLWPVFEASKELTVTLETGECWSFYLRGPDGEAMPGRLEPKK
jgi:hypothetical protein